MRFFFSTKNIAKSLFSRHQMTDLQPFTFSKLRLLIFDNLPQFEKLLGFFSTTVALTYEKIVIWPVERLYRHGPSVLGMGFWRGTESADICAAITGVSAKHWIDNEAECERRIEADIRSYVVLLETVLYFFIIYSAFRALCSYAALFFNGILHRRGWIDRYSPRLMGWVRHALPSPAPRNCEEENSAHYCGGRTYETRSKSAASRAKKQNQVDGTLETDLRTAASSSGGNDSSPYEVYAPKEKK